MSEQTTLKAPADSTNAAVEQLLNPINLYKQERVENEIDLVSIVRQRLVDNGLKDRLAEGFDQNRFITEAQGRNCCAQQYNLNRYFSAQLMAAEEDTTLERYSLLYEVNAQEWLTIFDNKILPALVQYDLPVAL